MTGYVDRFGRSLVEISVRATLDDKPAILPAWVDTAFNGDLVIPQTVINSLGLIQSGGIDAKLADGHSVLLESYSCVIEWFGMERAVEVLTTECELPLLGIGLLLGHRLTIDYIDLTLVLE